MQPHDVIDAQDVGVAHVMPQAGREVLVAGLTRPFGVWRGEIPVLAQGEEGVGRCPRG